MARPEIVPFADEHLDGAMRLGARREDQIGPYGWSYLYRSIP